MAFSEKIKEFSCWVAMKDEEVPELEESLVGMTVGGLAKPVYVYANYEAKKRLMKTSPVFKTKPVKYFEGEVLEGDEIKIAVLQKEQLAYLQARFLAKRIIPSNSADLAVGFTIRDMVFGVATVRQDENDRNKVFILCDFVVDSVVYERLAKLVLTQILSKEFETVVRNKLLTGAKYLYTKVFTKNPISMKYRCLFDLIGRRENGLSYGADMGKWTSKEGLEWWKQKHSKKRSK